MADRLFLTGIGGATLAAICCVTPLLPAFLGLIGAGGLGTLLYRDAVLLPLLGGFLLLTGYALWRRKKRS